MLRTSRRLTNRANPRATLTLPFAGLVVLAALTGPGAAQGTGETTPAPAAAGAVADQPAMGEWMTSSSLIAPSKYGADFPHYDYVNPDAPKGGVFYLSAPGTFDSFNPFLIRGTPAAGYAAFGGGLAYDTLMAQALDEPGVSHGLIAEALRYPADFSSVTFRLNPAARFHDDEPITVDDVIWSFQTVTRLYPLYANYYHNVVSVEQTAPGEVTFRFDQTGNRELPNIMGDLVVLPRHYWEAEGRNIDEPTLVPPLGSGPWRVKSFSAGSTIVWERAPNYWAANHPTHVGRNNFDEIRYTYLRDQNAAFEAFKRGGYQDYRAESSAQRWVEGYNFPAANDGRVLKATVPSDSAKAMQGYVMNTRREAFADPRVRRAVTLAYNFAEMNRTLFYDQYARTQSFFQDTELAATGIPEGAELALLEPFRAELPPALFTEPHTLPDYSQPGAERTYLREAFDLLTAAGYTRQGTQLVKEGRPLRIEFLGNDPLDARIFEPFATSLRRLGVETNIRIVDATQYLALTDNFEFDIITDAFQQSLSPGNEQRDFWSSAAAAQPGSRNTPGIRNPIVDALIEKIIYATDRASLVAATKALDRVLLWNDYLVPQWFSPEIRYAYWAKLEQPENQPTYAGLDVFSWWIRPDAPASVEPTPEGLPEGATAPVDDAVPGGETPVEATGQ